MTASQHYSIQYYNPSPELAHFVERYWIARWNLPEGEAHDTAIVPSPTVTATIMEHNDALSGAKTAYSNQTLTGMGVMVGITFLPGGLYPFYKKPTERFTNQTVPLKTIFQQARIKKIRSVLHDTDSVLLAEVEKMLLAKKPEQDGAIAVIGDIIENVKHDPNVQLVAPLIEQYGASERTLQYAFKNYVGIGLKWIILRYRLQDVADAIGSGSDWKTAIQKAGFTDQARAVRDFQKIFGETPADYTTPAVIEK